uniref:Uncharacterized protein LOC108048178 n=1 Tax=Drosophila rhopaloa TaxID=1041015 RepID=A0A6P4F199_DRORH
MLGGGSSLEDDDGTSAGSFGEGMSRFKTEVTNVFLIVSEARKKDKGQGMLLAMALMFGKMMAVMGLGGIAALAMKALGVSLVALMMAGMVGLKTAAQNGGESSHSISYVTGEGHHHKRRRRSTGQQPLAYRDWY